jgi:hypothetical protein
MRDGPARIHTRMIPFVAFVLTTISFGFVVLRILCLLGVSCTYIDQPKTTREQCC